MSKPTKVRLTLHVQSFQKLAEHRSIYFNHPTFDIPLELVLGDDIEHLIVQFMDIDIPKEFKPENMN